MDIGGFIAGVVQNVLANWIALGIIALLTTAYLWSVRRFGKMKWPVVVALGAIVLACLSFTYANLMKKSVLPQSSLKIETDAFVKDLRQFTSDTLKGIQLKYNIATPSVAYVDKGQYITLDRQSAYEQMYRGRAKSLRLQFESTLSCRAFGQSDSKQYEDTSIGAMRYVADDLERLASVLQN
jgi:hypothetical protein